AAARGAGVPRGPGAPGGLRPARVAGRSRAVGERRGVLRGRPAPGVAGGGRRGARRRRGRLPRRHGGGGRPMTAGIVAPRRADGRAGRVGFAPVLRAEWTKFRTVRGWVIGMAVAALVTVLAGLLAASGT